MNKESKIYEKGKGVRFQVEIIVHGGFDMKKVQSESEIFIWSELKEKWTKRKGIKKVKDLIEGSDL